MSLHAVWVHGHSVRPEWVDVMAQVNGANWKGESGRIGWSDVVGLSNGWGTTFRGKASQNVGFGGSRTVRPNPPENPFEGNTLRGYWFHFSIPAPVIVGNVRSVLHKAFVLWQTTEGARMSTIHLFDGQQRFHAQYFNHASGPERHTEDLTERVTMFTLPSPHTMRFGLGISVAVTFEQEGQVTFFSAGADFDVPGR